MHDIVRTELVSITRGNRTESTFAFLELRYGFTQHCIPGVRVHHLYPQVLLILLFVCEYCCTLLLVLLLYLIITAVPVASARTISGHYDAIGALHGLQSLSTTGET